MDRTNNGRTVTALFKTRNDAERAYDALTSHGISADHISIAMSEDTRKNHFGDNQRQTELGSKATEGAGVGGAIGGTIGGIVAAITAVAAPVVFPGIGLVISGPLVAALAGAGVGGLGGSLVGGLIGEGVPKEEVEHYESGLKEGGILLAVNTTSEDEADRVEDVLRPMDEKNV